jgi:hypothetical protein
MLGGTRSDTEQVIDPSGFGPPGTIGRPLAVTGWELAGLAPVVVPMPPAGRVLPRPRFRDGGADVEASAAVVTKPAARLP